MLNSQGSDENVDDDLGDYLTESERRKLLANLHHLSVWIGIQIPEKLNIDKEALEKEMKKDLLEEKDLLPEINLTEGVVDLRHLIWKLIHEKEISEEERVEIKELARVLKTKEIEDEDILKHKNLTHQEAKQLYEETAGLIRTLLDMKDILNKKERSYTAKKEIKRKVDDVKRWNDFVERVKKGL